jgi:hypothetical protein
MATKLFSFSCALVTSSFLVGCATVFTGTNQMISINSNVEGAEVRIDGNVVGTTPYSGHVRKASGAKTVLISKPGYQSQQVSLHAAINPVAIMSIVFWDLGTTDFLSGAAWEYTPNSYYVNLLKADRSANSSQEIRVKEYAMVRHRQIVVPNSSEARALHAEFFSTRLSFAAFQKKIAEIDAQSTSTVGFGEGVWSWLEEQRS